MDKPSRVVAYLRVSTSMQGVSGLGLEAQQDTIARFAAANGLSLIGEPFKEVQSGKGSDALERRPELAAAFAFAKREKAAVLVAKLDRLSRNAHFITGLMEQGVPFFTCDCGLDTGPMMLQIRAVVAEEERRLISARTKAALAAKKARGERLGTLQPAILAAAGAAGNVKAADAYAASMASRIRRMQAAMPGASMREIARAMNEDKIPSMRGAPWSGVTVAGLISRIENMKDMAA
jgi:DNA invertase Pin-like site-specific DNA recombinase